MKKLKARCISKSDENLLFNWANDIVIRQYSFDKKRISLKSHKIWFSELLNNREKVCFIFELKNNPIGSVRFERKSNKAKLNYLICKDYRGKGLAKPMLKLALNKIEEIWEKIDVLAFTIPDNIASKKSLQSTGFKLIDEEIAKNCYLYTPK